MLPRFFNKVPKPLLFVAASALIVAGSVSALALRQSIADVNKDSVNNAVGRQIALKAIRQHLGGPEADRYVTNEVLSAIASYQIIHHFREPRVQKLPPPDMFGCPALPKPAIAARSVYTQ